VEFLAKGKAEERRGQAMVSARMRHLENGFTGMTLQEGGEEVTNVRGSSVEKGLKLALLVCTCEVMEQSAEL
jgi:hypothetical protein